MRPALPRLDLIWTCAFLTAAALLAALLGGCGSEAPSDPQDLLLSSGDVPGMQLTAVSASQEESVEGPSALVELQGPGFRVLQSVVLFESRELALSALDGIRSDLVNRGDTEPGGMETSGILEHTLGSEEASSLFLIEGRALVRLTVTGPERQRLLHDLADIARSKLEGG